MYKCKYRIATEGGEILRSGDIARKACDLIERTNNKLKVCPNCRMVWEHVVETGHVKHHDEYYPILPRYGKPIETCPKCRGI